MISPKMPTGFAVRQGVFDNDTDGEFDDGVGVMGVWCGEVGGVDVEEDFTFWTTMHGVRKFENDGAPFGTVAEMSQSPLGGAVFSAVVTAMGTRTFGLNFRAFFDDGLWQIVEIVDSFAGIGQIVTGTGHGKILLETSVQGDNLPRFDKSVKSNFATFMLQCPFFALISAP